MKYVCKQVNPSYQESPMWRDYMEEEIEEMYLDMFLVPTEHCKGIHFEEFDKLMDSVENDLADEFDKLVNDKESAWYKNFTECVNDICPREDGKKYTSQQVHEWKELIPVNHGNIYNPNYFDRNDWNSVCRILSLVYGGEWDCQSIHGCCQGDYAEVYYKVTKWTDKAIECLETEYFNTGTEWECDLEGIEDEQAEDATEDDIGDSVWVYAYNWRNDDIAVELADAIGCSPKDIIMFEYNGSYTVDKFKRI